MFYDQFRSLDDEDKLVILPDEDTPLVTNVGVPTVVYRVIAGQLTKGAVVFQKEIYHLHVFWMGDETVLVNVLEQQIPYISQEDALEHLEDLLKNNEDAQKRFDEILAEENKIWDDHIAARGGKFLGPAWGWVDAEGHAIVDVPEPSAVAYDRWEQEFSIHPFRTRWYNFDNSVEDEIEVIIKHQFILKVKINRIDEREVEMLFVRVLRNLTRPHITYPQPLFGD